MLGFAQINKTLAHAFGAVSNLAEAAEVSTNVLKVVAQQWEQEQLNLLNAVPPPPPRPPRNRSKAAAK